MLEGEITLCLSGGPGTFQSRKRMRLPEKKNMRRNRCLKSKNEICLIHVIAKISMQRRQNVEQKEAQRLERWLNQILKREG